MVVRRIREHVATHNWFAVAIDVVIVVIGVFLGTQVSNWNQARIERQQGAEYRQRLLAELRSNEAQNENRRHYWSRVKQHAEAALLRLERGSGPAAPFVVDAYQASQILTSRSQRFTYDELISTGRIEHVGDARLRGELSGYYLALDAYGVLLDAVPPYRDQLRQKMPSAAQQAVRTQCPETIYPGRDGTPFVRMYPHCVLKGDAQILEAAARAVGATPGLNEQLNRLIADLDIKLVVLDAMDHHSRRLRALVEKAAARGV